MYAGYCVVLRRSLPDDDQANVAMFFGYVGLFCSVLFAPFIVILVGMQWASIRSIPKEAFVLILVEGEQRSKVGLMIVTYQH